MGSSWLADLQLPDPDRGRSVTDAHQDVELADVLGCGRALSKLEVAARDPRDQHDLGGLPSRPLRRRQQPAPLVDLLSGVGRIEQDAVQMLWIDKLELESRGAEPLDGDHQACDVALI